MLNEADCRFVLRAIEQRDVLKGNHGIVNRLRAGTVVQMTLLSISRTCRKLGREPWRLFQNLCQAR
jgi:hypothetical protein